MDNSKSSHAIDINNDCSTLPFNEGRQVFIIKTLSVVAIQLLVTAVITYFCYTSASFRHMGSEQMSGLLIGMFLVAITTMIICFIAVKCCKNNLIALIPFCIFTVSMSVLFAIGCLAYSVEVLVQAIVITAIVTVSCIGYILVTKKDLHSLHGVLFTMLVTLIICGIIMTIFPPSNTIQIVYASIGVVIFVGYILVDTSDIVNDRYSDDEYLIAAIGLYLDILNLMLYLLELLSKCEKE
jgi:FtsH-binding integral membrane protein